MAPISKSAPLGGKRHFSSSRETFAVDRAVSPALWREPRTSPLYVGQSLTSAPTRVPPSAALGGAVVSAFSPPQPPITRNNARGKRSRKGRLARFMFLFPFSGVPHPPSDVEQESAGVTGLSGSSFVP